MRAAGTIVDLRARNGENERKIPRIENNTTSSFDVRDVPSLTLSFSVSSLAAEHLGNKAVKGVLRWHLNFI